MEITQVKVFPVHEEKLKAFVSLVFDHCFMVNDIKVIQGKDGLFLSMPSRRKKSGEFKDVAHPLNHETRRRIEERVLDEYRRSVDDATPRRPDRPDESGAHAIPTAVSPAASVPTAAPIATPPATTPPAATPPAASSPDAKPPGATAPIAAAPSSSGPVARQAPDDAAPVDGATEPEDPTLEEVQERHLRDSFWSVS